MSNYVETTDLLGIIPTTHLNEALDDDGDGQPDTGVFDSVADTVSRDIDARLGQRYTTPFSYPYPAVVTYAARMLALEALYARRGQKDDKNPYGKQADAQRAKLDAIGAGTQPLQPGQSRAEPSATAITVPSKTVPAAGTLGV
jgi:phage gp36-like protein